MAKTATKIQETPALPPTTDNLPAPRARSNAVQAIVPANWQEITAIASAISRARMAPKSYCDKDGNPQPEKIAIAMMAGMEVGLTPMAALQSIAVINGTPSLWGDGLMAIVRHSGLLEDLQEGLEVDPKTKAPVMAWCKAKRRGESSWKERALTWPEVVRAGWHQKPGPWQQTPGRMMTVRVRGWLMRDMFADVLRGLHSAEEEQDMVDVTQRGSADFTPAEPEPQRSAYTEPKTQASATPASPGASADPVGDPRTPAASSRGEPVVADGPDTGKSAPDEEADAEATRQGQHEAVGHVDKTTLTDVEDLNETAPEEGTLIFNDYTKIGDFFAFADSWIEAPERTEAELVAFSAYYKDYILERLKPEYPHKEAMLDTKRILDESLKKAQKR